MARFVVLDIFFSLESILKLEESKIRRCIEYYWSDVSAMYLERQDKIERRI